MASIEFFVPGQRERETDWVIAIPDPGPGRPDAGEELAQPAVTPPPPPHRPIPIKWLRIGRPLDLVIAQVEPFATPVGSPEEPDWVEVRATFADLQDRSHLQSIADESGVVLGLRIME